MNIRTAGELSM